MLTPEEMDALLQESNGYAAELRDLPDGAAGPKVNDYLNASPTQQEAPPEPEAAPEPDDLDQFVTEQAEGANVEPEQEPVVSPAPKQNPVVAQTDGQQAQLVSTKPQWYDDLAPPKIDGAKEAASGLFGGLLNAFTAPSAKEGMGAFFKGVGKAADGALAAPQQDYANRLNAADKQADMHAKLNSGGRNSASLDLAERKYQHLLEKEASAAATEKALKTIGSPESNELVDAYISAGIFPPDAKKSMSGWQMKQGRVGAQQQAGAERGQVNWKGRHNIGTDTKVELKDLDNAEYDRRHEITEGAKVEGEERDQTKLNEQAYIPGWKAVGKRAPNVAAVDQARALGSAMEQGIQAANELNQIQSKLSRGRILGKAYQYFADDPEGKQALADAHIWQKQLMDSQREISRLGVLQGFEKAMVETTNPEAGTLDEFFIGPYDYNSYMRILPKRAAARMKAYGFAPDSDEEPAHQPQAKNRTASELLTGVGEAKKTIVPTAINAGKQAISGAADTVKQVAGAAPPAVKMLTIQVMDPVTKAWGAAREVTEDQYRQAMKGLAAKNLSPDHIRKAK